MLFLFASSISLITSYTKPDRKQTIVSLPIPIRMRNQRTNHLSDINRKKDKSHVEKLVYQIT